MPLCDGRALGRVILSELRRRGVAEDSARDVADSLVETSLRGVDSHGIHLLPYYISAVEGGRINKTPDMRVVMRRPAAATLDADRAFGHHAGTAAMRLAVEMADDSGVGIVGVRHSTHFGAGSVFRPSGVAARLRLVCLHQRRCPRQGVRCGRAVLWDQPHLLFRAD